MSSGRDHARINLGIWGDDDFRNLSPVEQHLYFVLWTSPNLSYCGAGDWLPKRLAKFAGGWTPSHIEEAAVGLEREKFVIIDRDTDEYLLRSWVKHDGLWKTPNMAVSVANARAALGSQVLRGVVVHEMLKLRTKHPDSGSWRREAVVSMLEQEDVDPTEIPTNNPRQGLVQPLDQPLARHSAPLLSFSSPTPTPSPTPATAHASRAPVPASRPASRAEMRLRELNATARSAAADQVAMKFNEWAGSGIPSQTLVEVAIEVDRLISDSIDPHQIADGIKAWHASDRIYPSQIPGFVAKAARPQSDTKPTKATLRAVDTMTAAEQIIAEMETA